MFLGIDYGTKKIGLSSSEGVYATTVGTISNTSSRILQIKEMIPDPIEKIIIGLPHSTLDPEIKLFASELEKEFRCPVEFEDEFNSTQEALQNMIEAGVKMKKRRSDDSNAATTILQRYLDRAAINN